jgi:hypothetical protein
MHLIIALKQAEFTSWYYSCPVHDGGGEENIVSTFVMNITESMRCQSCIHRPLDLLKNKSVEVTILSC